MEKSVFDEVIDLSVKHFVKDMSKAGWLGQSLEKNGFDLAEVSEDEAHLILIRTLVKLYDAFEEEIEMEEEEEDAQDDDLDLDLEDEDEDGEEDGEED